MAQREKLIEILSKYFTIGDSDEYSCIRDKSAFALGTMSLDDFVEFDEEKVADIADYLITNGVVVLPCKVGDTVYVNYIYGRNKIITDSQMVCSIEQTVGVNDESYWKVCAKQVIEKGYIVCYEYTEDDFGKTVYLTREEAEAALKKMEGEK